MKEAPMLIESTLTMTNHMKSEAAIIEIESKSFQIIPAGAIK